MSSEAELHISEAELLRSLLYGIQCSDARQASYAYISALDGCFLKSFTAFNSFIPAPQLSSSPSNSHR